MAYQLIPDTVSHDTVQALETLLAGARAGDVTGIAYAVALRQRRFITDVAGTLYRNATLARGMVQSLDDTLAILLRGREEHETR